MIIMKTDVLIVGSGVAGLFSALNLPKNINILIITKSDAIKSDSSLAQGGICMLRDDDDFQPFFDDTMRAGHFENDPESVSIMINASRDTINHLISLGVNFTKLGNNLAFTREGAHSRARILFRGDETGKEITSKLLAAALNQDNITIMENCTMLDLISQNNVCSGIIAKNKDGDCFPILSDYTILATGGIGGLFENSTNYQHLTADSLALAIKHNIKLKNISYIQIHPTTFYSKKPGRRFLISESVRGEGAVLLDANGNRFVDELLPRDIVSQAIFDQMKKDNSNFVWLSLKPIPKQEIISHFPNIYNYCLNEGYDITKEPIPVVPSQHYFMGGISVDTYSRSSMSRLYAVGETACNGVHGKNRLASNSLLESLVFAKRAAQNISLYYSHNSSYCDFYVDPNIYLNCEETYKKMVLDAIEQEKSRYE